MTSEQQRSDLLTMRSSRCIQ